MEWVILLLSLGVVIWLFIQARSIRETFKALSHDALYQNNEHFLKLASESFGKLHEGAKREHEHKEELFFEQMKKLNHQIQELEKSRVGAYATLSEQARGLLEAQAQLRQETKNLVTALKAPLVRGRWGEIQLKRVVEMAGMLNHCDFFEQESGGRLRPDMLIRLPSSRNIVVDAKAPLSAYLEAIEATHEEEKRAKLKEHAKQLRMHIHALAKKSYWEQFQPTPEFVILFLPGEMFFHAALEQDPSIIEVGVSEQVIVATPTTLIALLRSVAYGWRQESLSKKAEEISAMGLELYERLSGFSAHLSKVGKGLSGAVLAYNKAVGSLESRVLVSARKFKEMKFSQAEGLEEPVLIEEMVRRVNLPAVEKSESTLHSPQPSFDSLG